MFQRLRAFDRHVAGLTDSRTATTFGGAATVAAYVCMFLWTLMYIVTVYGSGSNIQSSTSIIQFPSNNENEETRTILLPPMKW